MDVTVEYLNTRKQFGVTLSTFQALRHRIADMKMQVELARSMSYYASLKLNASAEERRRYSPATCKVVEVNVLAGDVEQKTIAAVNQARQMTADCAKGLSDDALRQKFQTKTPEEEARNNFRWRPEGDRIFGPGTHDIKGGTVMMWLVLRALQAQHSALFENMTWKLLWNSSEEQLSHDFGDVCRARFDQARPVHLQIRSEE
jgi:hypothetical protein